MNTVVPGGWRMVVHNILGNYSNQNVVENADFHEIMKKKNKKKRLTTKLYVLKNIRKKVISVNYLIYRISNTRTRIYNMQNFIKKLEFLLHFEKKFSVSLTLKLRQI